MFVCLCVCLCCCLLLLHLPLSFSPPRWLKYTHCKEGMTVNIPLLHLSYINSCDIYTGGKFNHPPAIVRLQAGTCAEDRVRERACSLKGDGLTRPDAVWSMVSWVSRNPCSTASRHHLENCRPVIACAIPSTCRWGKLRAKGVIFEFLFSGSNAMDILAAAEGPQFKFKICPGLS